MITRVYHGSNQANLKILEPKVSSHAKEYVYGSENPSVALLFLTRWNDYIFRVGYEENQLYIVENYEGALKEVFFKTSGYLYDLEPNTFTYKKELWRAEVVSEVPVKVLNEKRIGNIYDEIVNLGKAGDIKVYQYPQRPGFYPNDDQDLIDRVLLNISRFGITHRDDFYKYHFHLKGRVEQALKEMNKTF